ncbi:ribonucleotide reductase of class III (anaerobic), activating protein [Escherichia phage vB_EcoM-CHD94UKE2]|nr:ribonucleotide reductase of class III (anaerobic), activating protein [Escherichia phage vB_EcoM-CHD94UKE2]
MNYDRIYPCCFVNGPGCRTVLFVNIPVLLCEWSWMQDRSFRYRLFA